MPLSQSDNDGSAGNALTLFEQAAELLAPRPAVSPRSDAKVLRAEAADIRRAVEAARALAEAAMSLRDAERMAAMLRRRVERAAATERRHLERERRRAEGGLYANERRAPNHPTRVDVHPDAWEQLKREALQGNTSVGYLIGALVVDAVRLNTRPYEADDGRCVTQRFARLVLVDADTWLAFRSLAFDAHVTAQRMLGVIVETEAGRLGWTHEVKR